jgi:uncharacterized membrane protein YciS (DUF1049 family)
MKLNHYYLHFALTSVVCLSSCNKSLYINSNVENEQIALHKLKDLVGEKGQLFTFNLKDSNSLDKVKSNNISDSTKILTFEEFKKIFFEIVSDTTTYQLTQVVDSLEIENQTIKPFSVKSNEEDDGPRTAGLYRFEYLPFQNGNSSLFANLNITFSTNKDGSINGVPSIYFTGINLFTWQPQQVSQISFNPSTYTSTFTITGTTVFGIQFSGGFTIGWTSSQTFNVKINMDEFEKNTVTISEQN